MKMVILVKKVIVLAVAISLFSLLTACSSKNIKDTNNAAMGKGHVIESNVNPGKEISFQQVEEMEIEYPSTWPNLVIYSETKKIPWIRGDANFTGKVNGVVGNTNFGYDNKKAKSMNPTEVKPNTVLRFDADQVMDLEKPKYSVWLINKNNQLVTINVAGNSISVPAEEGEYTFNLCVDWGRGDNTITYWFKVKVVE